MFPALKETKFYKKVQFILEKQQQYKFECQFLNPKKWYLTRTFFINEQLAILITDITRTVRREKRHYEFLSIASHEIKNPVTSIKAYAQLLRQIIGNVKDKRVIHYLKRIDEQIFKLVKIINDLLDVSRLQSGKFIIKKKAFSLDSLIKETVESTQASIKTHQIVINNSTKQMVYADKNSIGQVFTNLLINAIKYSPQSNKVIVSVDSKAGKAIINIQDFGIGIPKKYLKKIFEQFFRIKETPFQPHNGGLGLGLYVCAQIIQLHQETIFVKSQPGKGSTFSFTLPIVQ